ncbi:MAG: dipeptidase [Planctomycetota bacterium]|jgi:dipeptidase
MKRMKIGFRFLIFVLVPVLSRAPFLHACTAVVVGRKASADGAVIVGHNEVNGGRRILDFRRVGRIRHPEGATVALRRGGTLPQVKQTHAFLWSEMAGLEFSDGYLNEWGVAVVSNASRSREDGYDALVSRNEIRHGGIGYMLRRLVAERARTAWEGVKRAGGWIEAFGYADSGRTYVIADPEEAWLLSVVRGRRWIARRVPDDAAVLLPNVYIIGRVDLDDPSTTLGSRDIVTYAIRRGWFDPEAGKPFSFRDVYARDRSSRPDPRQHLGQALLMAPEPLAEAGRLPFCVKPARKLTVRDVMEILRNRSGPVPICNPHVQEGAVFQLRSGLPRAIGCVYWRTTAEPVTSGFTPWFAGILETPKAYRRPAEKGPWTLKHHFGPPPDAFRPRPDHAWWVFKALQDFVHQDEASRLGPVKKAWRGFEASLFESQPALEKEALALWKKDEDAAWALLTKKCGELAAKALEEAGNLQRAKK